MAAEGVIYPQSSLLLVDRTFQKGVQRPRTIACDAAPSGVAESTSSEMPHESFQFVTVTDKTGFQRKDAKHTVRSHVSRQVSRARALRQSKVDVMRKKVNGFSDPVDTEKHPRQAASPTRRSRSDGNFLSSKGSFGSVNLSSAAFFYATLPSTFLNATRLHQLLDHYYHSIGNLLYPLDTLLSYNPLQTNWTPAAVQDEIFFHTALLAASSSLDIAGDELKQHHEKRLLVQQCLIRINRRLQYPDEITSGTLSGVACLAMLATVQGQQDVWQIHMKGLLHMVNVAGLDDLDEPTRMKIYRADLEGASSFVVQPYLPPLVRRHLPPYAMSPLYQDLSKSLFSALLTLGCSSSLIGAYIRLVGLKDAVTRALCQSEKRTLDVRVFDEEILCIQQTLLSEILSEDPRSRALRLSALIFVKFLTRKTQHRSMKTPPLVKRLRRSLACSIVVLEPWKESTALKLLTWILLMGAMASPALSQENKWFSETLASTISFLPDGCKWSSVKTALEPMLWIDEIFGADGQRIVYGTGKNPSGNHVEPG